MAVQWAREAEDGPAAFAVIDGVKECRELLKQSNSFVDRLGAVLNAPNRVRAFPELRAGEERALSLLNMISMARKRLAEGLDAEEDQTVSGDMQRVREERRTLQKRIAFLPVTEADFAAREGEAQKQWNSVSQKLQQLTLQVDQLQAIVNGLKRAIREGPVRGVVRDPSSLKQFEAELTQNEADISVYKTQMTDLRKMIDISRMQVGFGDQRFVEDAEVRVAFRRVLSQETRLAAAGAGGRGAVGYAQRIDPILQQAEAADSRLEAAYADLEARVGKRASELKATLDTEMAKLGEFTRTLEGLDSEGRLVVGQVAMRNFQLVRDRLKNIVLRADVGVTEESWELREEQLTRVEPAARRTRRGGSSRRVARGARRYGQNRQAVWQEPGSQSDGSQYDGDGRKPNDGAGAPIMGDGRVVPHVRAGGLGVGPRVRRRTRSASEAQGDPRRPRRNPAKKAPKSGSETGCRCRAEGARTSARAGVGDLTVRRRRRRRDVCAAPAPQGLSPTASADAGAAPGARSAASGGDRIREERQRLPRRHHPHRPASL
jgi:hypothetical protein